ncbi:MAG: hypothetical protein ABL967_18115 [Bryobacteraceae bacterium]
MKRHLVLACSAALASLLSAVPSVAATAAEDIAQAIQPLPEELRADATVVRYDQASGARVVLREGKGAIECEPASPVDGFIRCYNKVTVPRREMEAKLRAEKKSDKDIQEAIQAATKSGALKQTPFGTMSYRLATKDGVIKKLWVMSVPFATPESIGVSTKSQRDAALKGQGLPWLMLPGTAGAHVMIPINN